MTANTELLKSGLADRYQIERELGAGGMATVYLAHDVRHDRKVALTDRCRPLPGERQGHQAKNRPGDPAPTSRGA